jgi:lipopolysaccharide export system protein LptA
MTRLGARICAAAIAGIAGGVAVGAEAQIASQSKSPIDVTADEAEVVQSKCMAVWRGAAEAIQDTTRLRADTITVYSKTKASHGADVRDSDVAPGGAPANCGKPDRFVADGNVYYVTPDRNARSDHAVYDTDDDQIVMTGNVIVVQGQDVARGDKLIINVADKQATMISDATGAGKPGRVRGVYFPATGAGAAPAAPH